MTTAETAFHRYLEWKEPIDERSLNRDVQQAFTTVVAAWGSRRLRVLDCGTGTGAMIRRLVDWGLPGELEIIGVDGNAALLEAAADTFIRWAGQRNYILRVHGQAAGAQQVLTIRTSQAEVAVRLYHQDLYAIHALEAYLPLQGAFDVVTALSLVDLLDEERGLPALLYPLRSQGLLYLLLNYDHETIFEPTHDRAWEAAIIEAHHRVIEHRIPGRVRLEASHVGRRLYHLLQQYRCEVLAYGASDWVSYPRRGGYPQYEALFLRQILDWVHVAAQASETLDRQQVEEWYRGRLAQLAQAELVYICRQNDILGRRLA